jgi:hypothetical protein
MPDFSNPGAQPGSQFVAHPNCRSVLGLISVFDFGPSVEADDGFVFLEVDASASK